MGKNPTGSSLIRFQQKFSSEQDCIQYLFTLKWPDGFRCRKCGGEKAYQLKVEPRVFQCAHCNCQESVTAGTLLHRTRTPLLKWFWAAYLLCQDKRGISAMHLSRELDLRYPTAWTMLHKLRRALAEQKPFVLDGVVEVDESYYGGKGDPGIFGRSLANENRLLLVMAVERKLARGKKMPGIKHSGFVAGSAKVGLLDSASVEELGDFLKASLKPGANLLTDGWAAYVGAGQGFKHEPVIQGDPRNAGRILPLVHLQFSNLKSWLNGTFHGVSRKHLPAYLTEWNYRFNRRGLISNLFDDVMMRAMRNTAITYGEIADGPSKTLPVHGLCV